MGNGGLIGALAIFTIGAVLLVAFGALGWFLRDPENRAHASNVAAGGKSATSKVGEGSGGASDVSLKERLDDASLSDEDRRSKEINKARAAHPTEAKHAEARPGKPLA